MPHDEIADVFARRADPEWEMFCRGRSEEASPWTDRTSGDGEPVRLDPDGAPGGRPGDTPAVRHAYSKVVGIPYPNEDGSSRREAVLACQPRQRVVLAHRPDNPVDANAVAVLREDGRQLGYLPAALAKQVVDAARGGTRYLAVVSAVTGREPDPLFTAEPVGARLLILALEGGATKAMARQYLRGLMNGSAGRGACRPE